MAINISDSGSTILLSITTDYSQTNYPTIPAQTRYIEKTILNIEAIGNQVVIFDRETKFSFLYSDITTPSGGANAIAVAGLIEAFKDTIPNTVPLVVSPMIIKGTATFTRPADTTAYAVSDAVCNSTSAPVIMSISLARAANIPFIIRNIRLVKGGNVTTNASFNLYLFNASVAAINDNAQWTMLTTDKAKYVDRIGFTMFTEGTGSTQAMAVADDLSIRVISADGNLYLVLVAAAAYTPANAEVFDVYVTVEQQ